MLAISNTNPFTLIRSVLGAGMLPLGILMVVILMIIPLPTTVLDIFFAGNILIGLLVLMLALHTFRPLDFSSFPTVLLIATVLRLALNVASTRIVLSEGQNGPGAAGKVIEAFGEFVVAGNFVVGIFVFVILVIINLVVITKGAGRVSEVSARFTLDAMPGKQMAIDADINAGVITPEQAKERREELSRETDFYSAMDGASKFVKGDAIAGLLILVINVVGGLAIGVGQHNLPFNVAAENYVLLSVGDGLAAQVPSLLLSIATAIIVTRVSAGRDMAEQVTNEMSISRAWFPAAGVLLLLGIVPGMPNTLFFIFGGVALLIAVYVSYRARTGALDVESVSVDEEEEEQNTASLRVEDVKDNSAISINLSYTLLDLVDDEDGGPLVERVTSVRKELSSSLGFVIPQVRISDDINLPQNAYRIKVGQTIVGEDTIYLDRKLALPAPTSKIKFDGIDVKDPAFGMDSTWIRPDQQVEAETDDYVIVDPDAIIATHLSQIIKNFAHELIGQDDVQALLDNLETTSPNLVNSLIPKLVALPTLTTVLRRLLMDKIPISDLKKILEALPELVNRGLSTEEMAEALRPDLVELLIQQIVPINNPLPVVIFDTTMEEILIAAGNQSDSETLMLETTMAEQLVRQVSGALEKLTSEGRQGIVVTAAVLRKKLMNFMKIHIPDIIVLGINELPYTRKLDVAATIGEDTEAPKEN